MNRKHEVFFRVLLWFGVLILIITLCVSVSMRTARLNEFFRTAAIPDPESIDFGYTQQPALTLLHILPGVLFMLLGALQFIKPFRDRFLAIHRLAGKIYMVPGVLIGITALLMSFLIQFGGVTESSAVAVSGSFFKFD